MNSRERFVGHPRTPDGFDLSRNKSLRTLEITAHSIDLRNLPGSGFLRAVLSSIATPAPLDVVIIYRDRDFDRKRPCRLCTTDPAPLPYRHYEFWGGGGVEINHFYRKYKSHFALFREMHSVRRFRLVLCLDVSHCVVLYALEILQGILRTERFRYLLGGPFITYERRVLRVGPTPVVRSMTEMPPTSAL